MMKEVTILTFDEMEEIRNELDRLVDDAKDGANEKHNPKHVCDWLVDDLRKLRERFD